MQKKLIAACGCNMGLIRTNNEDNFFFNDRILPEENTGLDRILSACYPDNQTVSFGVFDGMGGEAAGETASYRAAASFGMQCKRLDKDPVPPKQFLTHAVTEMNRAVCADAVQRRARMGSTGVILHFRKDLVCFCNIGDSRGFLFREGTLRQITKDHTDAEILAKKGITNRKPSLRQYLGIPEDELELEPTMVKVRPGLQDQYLICSDGLTDMLSEAEIAEHLREKNTAKCVHNLIQDALAHGGKDNVTVILVRIQNESITDSGPLQEQSSLQPEIEKIPMVPSEGTDHVPPLSEEKEFIRPEMNNPRPQPDDHIPNKPKSGAERRKKRVLAPVVVLLGIGLFCALSILIWRQKGQEASAPEAPEIPTEAPADLSQTPTLEYDSEPDEVNLPIAAEIHLTDGRYAFVVYANITENDQADVLIWLFDSDNRTEKVLEESIQLDKEGKLNTDGIENIEYVTYSYDEAMLIDLLQKWKASEEMRSLLECETEEIEAVLEQFEQQQKDNGLWDIWVENLSSGAAASLQIGSPEENGMISASIIKIFIMAAVYEQVDQGLLMEEDVDQKIRQMITISDNYATNQLIDLLGAGDTQAGMDYVNGFAAQLGCHQTRLSRKMLHDGPQNLTSAEDCALILRSIYHGTCVSASWSEKMLAILSAQEIGNGIKRIKDGERLHLQVLPDETIVASKTGNLSMCVNEVAIVFSPQTNYILCVLHSDPKSYNEDPQMIAQLSVNVYNLFNSDNQIALDMSEAMYND